MIACCTSPLFCAPVALPPKRLRNGARRKELCMLWNGNGNSNDIDESRVDKESMPDAQFSRRVFNTGVLASTVGILWVGSRLLLGDDLKARVRRRLHDIFPDTTGNISDITSGSSQKRRPVDRAFATRYLNAISEAAIEENVLSIADLIALERGVQERARPLFFTHSQLPQEILSNPEWLNFVLYSRLHAIASKTSPMERARIAQRVARRTMPAVMRVENQHDAEWARLHAPELTRRLESLLEALVEKGWISGYEVVNKLDNAEWTEDGRSNLTLFVKRPVTMQAAQLLAEEQYEDIAPKISAWIVDTLKYGGVSSVSYEDYFLDEQYRPDPAEFAPSVLATELDLSIEGVSTQQTQEQQLQQQ